MPELPISDPQTEIFATTLGIMLYPGLDNVECAKAKAFTSQYLSVPLERYVNDGGIVSPDYLLELATSSGQPLNDLPKRWQMGNWAGDYMIVMATLCMSHLDYASSSNAIRIMEQSYAKTGTSGVRSSILEAFKTYSSVAHLWGTWNIWGGFSRDTAEYNQELETRENFLRFLAQAENLFNMGREWELPGSTTGKKTLIGTDPWRLPEHWPEFDELFGDDRIAGMPQLSFDEDLLLDLKPLRNK